MCDVKATVTPTITTNNNTWAIVTTAVVAPLFLVSSVLLFWSWTKKRKPHKK
jgi:preprotein translocase subunit SecG